MTAVRTRPPTLQDVAGALGMHKSTVSLALSGKGTISADTRRRILAAAREMGYEPDPVAQRLAQGQGRSTICLFSGTLDVGLTTEKILLIQRALTAQGLEVPLYTCCGDENDTHAGESQAAQVRQLCRQRPRSVICAAQRVYPEVFRELDSYQRAGGQIVSYDTPTPLICDQIVFDREDNAYRAARYVLEQGHRRLGLALSQVSFATPEGRSARGSDNSSDPQMHRVNGFRRALAEFGAQARDDWFFFNGAYERGGAEMARQFLAMPANDRPTALCIVNDYVALAFMTEVIRAGIRIPQDLSVIGHDNQPIAAYCPVALTSMSQPAERIAQAVADRVLGRLNSPSLPGEPPTLPPPQTIVVTGDLIVRESVAPPPPV